MEEWPLSLSYTKHATLTFYIVHNTYRLAIGKEMRSIQPAIWQHHLLRLPDVLTEIAFLTWGSIINFGTFCSNWMRVVIMDQFIS